jgi:hypothetical protein
VTVGGMLFRNAIKIGNLYVRLVNGRNENPQPETTIWFAPELGWFVKLSNPPYDDNGYPQSGTEDDLVNYILR